MTEEDTKAVDAAYERMIAVVNDPHRVFQEKMMGEMIAIEQGWGRDLAPEKLLARFRLLSDRLDSYDKEALGSAFEEAWEKNNPLALTGLKSFCINQVIKMLNNKNRKK
jgi:hypothetical protein